MIIIYLNLFYFIFIWYVSLYHLFITSRSLFATKNIIRNKHNNINIFLVQVKNKY